MSNGNQRRRTHCRCSVNILLAVKRGISSGTGIETTAKPEIDPVSANFSGDLTLETSQRL